MNEIRCYSCRKPFAGAPFFQIAWGRFHLECIPIPEGYKLVKADG